MKRIMIISFSTILVFLMSVTGLYKFGRSLWSPVVTQLAGEHTVADRISNIIARKPGLAKMPAGDRLLIVAYKQERELEVWVDRTRIDVIPILAASGGPGPKLQEGDNQVPEGIYRIDLLNPNSSYYLSMRVSYPNGEDVRRSGALGIKEIGGDIYIHGKQASIGCLAIGDDKIEDLFYDVNRMGLGKVKVVILPGRDMTDYIAKSTIYKDLYLSLKREVDPLRTAGPR